MKVYIKILLAALILSHIISCDATVKLDTPAVSYNSEEKAATEVMRRHLNSVTTRSIEKMKATIGGGEDFEMLLPSSERFKGEKAFLDYHQEWFQDSLWTFETKIISKKVGSDLAAFTTEVIYREPERDGKPYYNRMHVSYTLAKSGGDWKVIKDHCSSIEKSTD